MTSGRGKVSGMAFDCAALKPDDRVWIEWLSLGRTRRLYARVLRLTPHQVVVGGGPGGGRFWKSGGSEVNAGLLRRIVGIATDEEIKAFEAVEAADRTREMELEREEARLRMGLPEDATDLSRHGSHYRLTVHGLTAGEVRKLARVIGRFAPVGR